MIINKRVYILCQSYPNPSLDEVGSSFVHVRAKYFIKHFDVTVLCICKEESYNFDNINVICFKDEALLNDYVNENRPDIFIAHFCEPFMYRAAKKFDIPMIIWVHGSEAHSWYRILFLFRMNNIRGFAFWIRFNTISLLNFRKMIKDSNNGGKIHFVFVSKWMKDITSFDTFISIKNYSIIANPIDDKVFIYNKKTIEDRKKILLLRSFNSTKYANDISINAILQLSKKPFFNELEFQIYGKGYWFDILTEKVKHFKNVKISQKFFTQNEIPKIHKEFGIFLCPTRMDAQGVSMCEAMSSGLVPLTSNNTAIPEFVIDNKTGYLTKSANELASKIEYLYNNPQVFLEMSDNAAKSIIEIAGIDSVMLKEKNEILKMIS